MSYVIAAPEMMAATATDLATIGSNLGAAHMTAAAPTVAVIPAAADEVSGSIAHLFSGYAQGYQALAGQAAVFHEQFVQHLTAGAGSYAATEAANASLLQPPKAAATTPITPTTLPDQIINWLTQTTTTFIRSVLGLIPPNSPLFYALLILFFPIWFPVALVLYAAFVLFFAQLPPGTII